MGSDAAHEVQTVIERRRTTRTPLLVRVEYATVDALFSEFTRNINEGGLFIETDNPPELDSRVQLQFCLPGGSDPIKVTGRVAWHSSGTREEPPGVGVEFGDLDAEARDQINLLVQQLRVEGNHGR